MQMPKNYRQDWGAENKSASATRYKKDRNQTCCILTTVTRERDKKRVLEHVIADKNKGSGKCLARGQMALIHGNGVGMFKIGLAEYFRLARGGKPLNEINKNLP